MNAPHVVSLVPSATETLISWGIAPIAVTRFCERPELAHVGGTKDPDVQRVIELEPDLVVMCVEENRREDADALQQAGVELFVFDVDTVDDVSSQVADFAVRLGVEPEAWDLPEPRAPTRRAFVPIWRRPWMSLTENTYGSSLLSRLGIVNVFADRGHRYPEVTLEEASEHEPHVVLAPSEPYRFSERHRAELEAVAPVVFVDGKDLFWWGARTPSALGRLHDQLVRMPTQS